MKIAKYNIDKDTVKGGKAAVVRVPGAIEGGGMVMAEKADYAERARVAEQAEDIAPYSSVWDTIDEKDKDVKSFAQKLSDTLRAYVDKSFLSKLQDDTAKGLITFLKGLAAQAVSHFKGIVNDGDITNKGDIHTKNLTVTGKATFFELEILKAKALSLIHI